MFSVMPLSRSSSKDSKLSGLEGVTSWGCSGVSAATGERSCAVSMGEDWELGTEGLGGGIEKVARV